ncbi:MAG: hypothetical protein RL748_489 [Pseudomonadota bacterium]|jgi:methyl-accepting chemotaxis protein-1 (serine sensor receptor)
MLGSNLTIKLRLQLFTGLFLLVILGISLFCWQSIYAINQNNEFASKQSALMTQALLYGDDAQLRFKNQIQAWKNILLRGSDPAQLEKYRSEFTQMGEKTQADLQALGQLLQQLKLETPMLAEVQKAHSELGKNYLNELSKFDGSNPGAIDVAVKGMDRVPSKKMDEIVDYVAQQAKLANQNMVTSSQNQFQHSQTFLIAAGLFSLLIGFISSWWLLRSIVPPLAHAVDSLKLIAGGDLGHVVVCNQQDEVGDMLKAMEAMRSNFQQIVGDMRTGAETIATEAAQIATDSLDLSARTEQQASSLEETASAMDELTSTVRQNGDNASQANVLAMSASDVASKGGQVVAEVVTTMESINASSRKIVDIISVIDGIAFQTNILALNAAVEAARAGEQGRGFAVVASEVRNLAQRSAAAAKEIKILINDSVEKVDSGSQLVHRAGMTMSEIVDSVKRVTDIMAEISTASQEQIAGIEQVNIAVSEMDGATQQNAALVEEAAAIAELLQDHAATQNQLVSRFDLGDHHTYHQLAKVSAATHQSKLPPAKAKPRASAAISSAKKPPAKKPAVDDWEEF